MTFAIWDQQSANIVGDFESEVEALAFVRAVMKQNSNIALGWALAMEDEDENVTPIAAGRNLLLLAIRPESQAAFQAV